MKNDLHNSIEVEQVIDPATQTADVNGSGADLRGFEYAEVLVHVGESGDTLSGSVKWDFELEESDDDSTYTDVAEEDMIGGTSGATDGNFGTVDDAAEDDAVIKVGYRGTKRYIRPVLNATGTHTNGTPIGATVLKGGAHDKPVS